MVTDKPDGGRNPRLAGFIAAAAVLAAVVGGYLYYQNSRSPEVTAGSQQSAAPSQTAQGTPASGATASGTPADSAAKPASQVASGAAAPTGQPSNAGGQPAAQAPSTDSAPAVSRRQDHADARPAPNGNNPSAPAAGVPQSEQSKSTSLPTNEVAYVRKSHANIRAEPNVRGKLVGQVPKGTKLNILARSGKWAQVEDGNTKGWISGNLLSARSP